MALSIAALALRPDAPALTPDQARMMAAPALADALLATGHPSAVEALVGTEGMVPPPPPGPTEITPITLYLKAAPSRQKGFCERIVAQIALQPAQRLGGRRLAPALPDRLATSIAYRWIGNDRGKTACEAPRWNFFAPDPAETASVLKAVRLLARAQQEAKAGKSLPFPISVDDQYGPQMLEFERSHPALLPLPGLKIITDGQQALADLPMEAIRYAGPADRAFPMLLKPAELAPRRGIAVEAMTLFLADRWTASMVLGGRRIVLLRLRRAIPAPF
ncbi:hypothetical protein [Sphingomonas crusticola]|uniref:hypothetical protein n=1 Tax=Sphingomonas crusticola TaxID=1697973 RepID=UPI0013C36459|nr:hypothetical protein [Sphingomonas crusticola]